MTEDIVKSAAISKCGTYRYHLGRRWSDNPKTALFVMLNPSTADASEDDATIRRCKSFAKAWGCGALSVVNLFAFRATDPRDMKAAADPVGPDNEQHFKAALTGLGGGPVVCAWGNHGDWQNQCTVALKWIRDMGLQPMALKVSKISGQPSHPLYLKKGLMPQPFGYGGNR